MKKIGNNKILNFVKTDHFMHRQWERKIDDATLRRILPFVPDNHQYKHTAIITPGFMQKKRLIMPYRPMPDSCTVSKCLKNHLPLRQP